MAFSAGSGEGPMCDINIIPLADVMLVLLIIFMVTAPKVSYPIDIDLPQRSLNPPPTTVDPPDPIRLRIDAAGQIFWNDSPTPVSGSHRPRDSAARLAHRRHAAGARGLGPALGVDVRRGCAGGAPADARAQPSAR